VTSKRTIATSSQAALRNPDEALAALCTRIEPTPHETIPWSVATDRVLAESIRLDRPSPACDVSAMDGYAVRSAGLPVPSLDVVGDIEPGREAAPLPHHSALRIFTGAMIPAGADAVIPREQVREHEDRIELPPDLKVTFGQHIRRQGENAAAGAPTCEPGGLITPARLAAIASCGQASVRVHRRVRVGVLVTGNEVKPVDATPEAWELRDSNGAALLGMLSHVGWIEPLAPQHVGDERSKLCERIATMLDRCDALCITGGVSAGDHDYVPGVLRELGCEIVFHKLAIRPGKPMLGAIDPEGRPVFGLPGNPVSVMVTARRLAAAGLRVRGGLSADEGHSVFVDASGSATAPPHLHWFPAVRLIGNGRAEPLLGKGSGDWVAAAASDGFVEIPPGEAIEGRRRFRPWTMAGLPGA